MATSLLQTQSALPEHELQISAEDVLLLQAEFLSQHQFTDAVTALAMKLQLTLFCHRASIGWLAGDAVNLIGTSGTSDLHARQETTRLLIAAMEEAAEQGQSLMYPEPDTAKPAIVLAQHELARHYADAVCSVPIVHAGQLVGTLTLERQHRVFSVTEVQQIEHLCALLAPCLALKFENDLPFGRRLTTWLTNKFQRTDKPQQAWLIASIACILVLMLALLLIPTAFRITAPARLEGVVQRVLAAPTDGYLYQVHVRPGDQVKAGQVLAELAEQDLLVEQRGLAAELAQQQNALLSAQARNDQSEFVASQGRADALRAKLELVEERLTRSHVRAPFDGIVIKGDLTQTVGAPIKLGEELMTLSPAGGYRVLIEVPEADIADLQPGQKGQLILTSMPSQTLVLHIERLTPLATTVEGRHYFPVYAQLAGEHPTLRPGMQGYAKIDIDRRPLLLNWINRGWSRLRFLLWSWGM